LIEYRRYDVMPGRMQDLHRRFEEHALPAFRRHGIRPLGFWEPVVGRASRLHYILQWSDFDERSEKWAALQADEDWITQRAASEINGPIVRRTCNELWTPTQYSPHGLAGFEPATQ
jgi:hypothetical protein